MRKTRKLTGLFIALLLAISFVAQPIAVFADTYGEPAGYVDYDYLQEEVNEYPQEEEESPFQIFFDLIPELTRFAILTEEAREIALYDFDHLAEMMLQVAPTRHVFARVFDISLEDYLALLRQMIYDMIPIPSFTALEITSDRWVEAPTEPLMIAADYLYSLLLLFVVDTGGFGHFIPQNSLLVEHTFFSVAYDIHHEDPDPDATRRELEEMGFDADWVIASGQQFAQFHYDIFNTPSVLWFYDIDPSEFDFDVNIWEELGTMNEDNITTNIIEPGRIAYIRIASFMNNLIMDGETLFPFYEEIQDFEHLIIDIRGNGGGMAGSFPINVLSMLISENLYSSFPEFFVADPRTAPLFENPGSMALANFDGIVPAAEFVQSQNMTQFNRDDLAILDYAIVWNAVYTPAEDAIPFGGEIWLLIDGFSASASVLAAQMSYNTGFATVVGEPTSRVTGVVFTHAILPNTGVLFRIDLGYTTDQYGRSIEEFGIIPHIPNMPGMDALETVLAIINDEVADVTPVETQEGDLIRYINGVAFLRLRHTAYSLGATVEWDGPSQSVIVTTADGSSFLVVVSEYGVINYNGRVYVPVENAEVVLADLLG